MFKGFVHILYHIIIIVLSAVIALSMPLVIRFIARRLLAYWVFIEDEKLFLVSVEISTAVLLFVLFNYIGRSWKYRKISRVAKVAGLFFAAPAKRHFAKKKSKTLKKSQGFARDIMVLGSTGHRTFVNPEGDLHHVLCNCRSAKIMLLDPGKEGAGIRSRSLGNPDVAPGNFGNQIIKSIDFLKHLRKAQKNIRLKLYPDVPLMKLAIFSDYIFMQHYQTGIDAEDMPEYVFRHDKNNMALYSAFYHYFLARWNNPDIPEYELDTDDLVYRDKAGNEIRRENFNEKMPGASIEWANRADWA